MPTTRTHSLPRPLEAVARAVVAKLRLPPGVTHSDALQDARALVVKRSTQGYEGARLHQRVWGDLKDEYGRSWRAYYSQPEPSAHVDLSRAPNHKLALDDPDPSVALDVRAAITKLTPYQQFVVIEHGLNGRSQADVAAERGVSEQAVKITYMRARRKLAELLAAYRPEDDA